MKILFCIRDDGDMTEPMNIMMLSALARRAGHFVSLWVIERDDPREIIKKEKPDIAAFSCITGSHKFYIEAARIIKKINPKIKTIFGGPHFTFFPGEVLKSVGEIDIVCVGEGYDAWPETLSALEAGSPVELIKNIITPYNAKDVLELEPLNGLVQLNAGEDKSVSPDRYTISKSHLRPQRINLDELPLMDRELIYNNTDFKHRYKRTMMASYGCPFRCAYCFEHQFSLLYKGLGKPRRWYSVDRFLEELEYVKRNWDTRFFKFYDDVMIPFPNDIEIAWHEEFCRKYPSKIGLPFHLLTRCDLVVSLKERKEVDVLSDWKKAGMVSMTMSIESGNEFIRDHVITRDMSTQEITKAFKWAYDAGICVFPNTILGIPVPIIPNASDPDFHKKIGRVAEEFKILRKLNGTKIDMKVLMDLAKQWSLDEYARREFIVRFLESAGLCHDYISYNVGSVKFTLDQKPGFPEFATLFPYPKTRINDWCIARGDFSGDFEKLHASYQTRSPLSCYTEYEKSVIQNLAMLGTFVSLFVGSRKKPIQLFGKLMERLFIDKLSKVDRPWATKLYLSLYALSKAYMHRTRVYPMKYSFKEKIRFYVQMIKLDRWKQLKKWSGSKKRP